MTLRKARSAWARRRRRYVVGYIASGNCLYHHQRWDFRKRVSLPLTRKEAEALLKKMPATGAAIFELTPIAVGGGAR